MGSLDFSVGIATDYGLDGRGAIPGKGKIFLQGVKTDSGVHPASYLVRMRCCFPGDKAAGEYT
jgi:hypothetical protein